MMPSTKKRLLIATILVVPFAAGTLEAELFHPGVKVQVHEGRFESTLTVSSFAYLLPPIGDEDWLSIVCGANWLSSSKTNSHEDLYRIEFGVPQPDLIQTDAVDLVKWDPSGPFDIEGRKAACRGVVTLPNCHAGRDNLVFAFARTVSHDVLGNARAQNFESIPALIRLPCYQGQGEPVLDGESGVAFGLPMQDAEWTSAEASPGVLGEFEVVEAAQIVYLAGPSDPLTLTELHDGVSYTLSWGSPRSLRARDFSGSAVETTSDRLRAQFFSGLRQRTVGGHGI